MERKKGKKFTPCPKIAEEIEYSDHVLRWQLCSTFPGCFNWYSWLTHTRAGEREDRTNFCTAVPFDRSMDTSVRIHWLLLGKRDGVDRNTFAMCVCVCLCVCVYVYVCVWLTPFLCSLLRTVFYVQAQLWIQSQLSCCLSQRQVLEGLVATVQQQQPPSATVSSS